MMLGKLMYSVGGYGYSELVSSYANNHRIMFDYQFATFKRKYDVK